MHSFYCLLLGLLPLGLTAQVSPEQVIQDSLLQLAETYPDDSLSRKSWLLHQAGNYADDAGDQEIAIVLTQRALELRLQDEMVLGREVVISAYNLGSYHVQLGQLKDGLEYFDMILNRAPNAKEGVAYYQIARCYAKMGAFTAGEEAFSKAVQFPPFAEDDYARGLLKLELGKLHLEKNNRGGGQAAIPVLNAALRHFADAGDTNYEQMLTLNLLGWGQTEVGEYERALVDLQSAEILAGEMEIEDEDLTAILSNLGLTYRRMNRPRVALRYYRQALSLEMEMAEDGPPNLSVAPVLDNMSTAFLRLDLPDSALHYAQQALRWSVTNYVPTRPRDNPDLADLTDDPLSQLIYLQDKARAHFALGSPDDPTGYEHALTTYRRADELLDQMRRNQLLADTRNYWRADARKLYAEALDVAVAAGDPVSAFYFMEKARARLLLDELSAAGARAALPEAASERLATVVRATRQADNSPAALRQFRRVQDSIFAAFPAYARASVGAAPPDPARLQDILGDGALVQYFVSEAKTMALTWAPSEGMNLVTLAPPSDWRALLTTFRQAIANPYQAFPEETARALYTALILPLHLPPGQKLSIVPDGELYLLPFGALLTTDPDPATDYQNWPWLAGERTINYAFSVQLIDLARRQRGRGNGRILALAPVARLTANDDLDPRLELPATQRTIRHLTDLLPTDTLLNAAANRDTFRSLADDYSLLHLGTHAFLDGEAAAGFLLRDGNRNRYTTEDLNEHYFRADLVVIGACETGLGERLLGEGVASLGRSFARRGAPSLIMSLWSIDDAMTAEVLNETYNGLATGAGPATALNQAGETYRQAVTNPTFGHPYYWAGLVAYGPDEGLALGDAGMAWWWWAIIGLLLIIGVRFLVRRGKNTAS